LDCHHTDLNQRLQDTNMSAERVALVVGASSGMGRATAQSLLANGYCVMAVARRTERLEELLAEHADAEDRLVIRRCDVTQPDDVAQTVAETVQTFGRVDILIYATGTNIPRRSLDVLSRADWSALIETNLTGAFHCTQAVLPVMRKQQSGLIIYLSTG